MTLRARIFGFTVIAAAVAGAAVAQIPQRGQAPDSARIAAAKDMMVQIGAVKQFDEVMPLIFDQLSRSFISLAPGKAAEIRDVFDLLVPRFMQRKGELINQIAVLYAEELTLPEINAIVAFYKSPIGLKFSGVQQKVLRESMLIGQRWGERIGRDLEQEARRELRRRGVDL